MKLRMKKCKCGKYIAKCCQECSDCSRSRDAAGSICTWCDEPIEADHPSVPDVNGEAGERQHIGCSVEEADDIGFDGFMQDQG